MKKVLLPLAAIQLALCSACVVERSYDAASIADEERFTFMGNEFFGTFSNYTNDEVEVVDARLRGDIGPMRDVDSSAMVGGMHDRGFTALEVIMTDSRGSAMTAFMVQGGIDHPDFAPGSSHRFTMSSWGDAVYVEAMACAGDGEPGDWSYDEPVEEILMTVEETEDPNVNRVNFTTNTSGDIATGHVDLALGQ